MNTQIKVIPARRQFIINSLLDTDFYKFTMGQLIFHKHRRIQVRFAFKNRTASVPLAQYLDEMELRRELDHVRTLKFSRSELHYLHGTNEYNERMFKEDYLEFLADLKLPPYELRREGDEYRLEFAGDWAEVTYWEIYALAIVNELLYRAQMKKLSYFEQELVYATGIERLAGKIKILRENPEVTFCDFGTRRRFSGAWQSWVVKTLKKELPKQFLGTSNVYLARKYALLPMGTSAHELPMVMAGLAEDTFDDLVRSQRQVLDEWWQEYDYGLSIALGDTFGTPFFFKYVMTAEHAKLWKGSRQDSGNPIEKGEETIAGWKSLGADPSLKLEVFSDGLVVEEMLKIHNHFRGRLKDTYGWGTNLTNDLGFKAVSIIVKPAFANGRGLVKLSDNIAKATGKPEDIEKIKELIGYNNVYNQTCIY